MNEINEKKLPAMKFSAGGITATLWENAGKEDKTFFSVVLDKRYMDKEGEWQSTTSLNQNDLPKANLVLAEAFKYICITSKEKAE